MSNEIEVSNTALVVIFIGAIVGIILSIVLYKRKTLNERFIEKCRKEGCTAPYALTYKGCQKSAAVV
mgnify:CR=1 FL=1